MDALFPYKKFGNLQIHFITEKDTFESKRKTLQAYAIKFYKNILSCLQQSSLTIDARVAAALNQ